MIGLAALALPRAFLHDLGIDVDTFGIVVLAVGPPAIWIFVAVRARVPSPVLTLVAVGTLYGLALGIVHNLTWNTVFDDGVPPLDEELAGRLGAEAGSAVVRAAMTLSSIFTGMVIGLIAGLIAAAIRHVAGTDRRDR